LLFIAQGDGDIEVVSHFMLSIFHVYWWGWGNNQLSMLNVGKTLAEVTNRGYGYKCAYALHVPDS